MDYFVVCLDKYLKIDYLQEAKIPKTQRNQ